MAMVKLKGGFRLCIYSTLVVLGHSSLGKADLKLLQQCFLADTPNL